jgi:hypothetical protein
VLAEVKIAADYASAGTMAFGSLFQYISKGNKSSEQIAMTAPVIAVQKADASEWFVSFVMPAGSTLADMPDPNDPRVVLRELGAEICIAASFKGRATEELAQRKEADLRAAAMKENIQVSDETRICRFDPPLKPGILQYNEVVIPTNL